MEQQETRRGREQSAHEKMIRGSAWMTAGSVMSRILGAAYILPWWVWMGTSAYAANALFTKSYQIYSIFIIISTAGIPGAVSKQIARYNAMGEYRTSMRLFRHGMVATGIIGIISAIIMWCFAPVLADGDPNMIPVIHSLSWALVVIPFLSILRGFFQGHSDMASSAISQFVEQVVRVGYMLASAYAIMKIGSGDYVAAVTQSTFAACIGAVAGTVLLGIVFLRDLPAIRRRSAASRGEVHVSVNELLIDIMRQAVPFIIMDSAITWYYLIDQYTFFKGMKSLYDVSMHSLNNYYAMFAGNANKLIMIVVSLATAMAVTAIPLLSGAITRHDRKQVSDQISNILQLFFFIMLPSALGMMAIDRPLYVLFYDYNPLGFKMLSLSAILAVFLGLFTICAALLQGLFHNRLAIKLMVWGVVAKLVCQLPFMYLFNVYGPMLTTLVGMAVSCGLMLHALRVRFHFRTKQTARRVMGMLAFSIIMYLGVRAVVLAFGLFLNPASKFQSVIVITGALVVGVALYGYLVLKTHLADMVLGARIGGLRRRLHIKD